MQLDSTGEAIFGLAVAIAALVGVAVSLRFVARAQTKATYAADDWWVVISVAFFYMGIGLLISSKWCLFSLIFI